MNDLISGILSDSVTAPSPDNFQPWRFEVRGSEISVFKVPGKVNHLLDYNEHVLLLTNGMLIENIVIAASHHKFRCAVDYFPQKDNADLLAKITLQPDDNILADTLYDFLKSRCTNRKMYSKKKIAPEIISDLNATGAGFPELDVKITTDQKQIRNLGKAVSSIDQVMFENRQLHDSLFEHITWSREEEQRTNQGLNLDSMEFNFGEKLLFKALKNWGLVAFLNAIGFSKFVRFKNSMQYSSAAASMLVSAIKGTQMDYLLAGRLVQRVWLNATRHHISLHPIVGVLYCYQKVTEEKSALFSEAHAALLKDCYKTIQAVAALGESNPVIFYCRMGYADKTSYQSSRKQAEIKFLN